ncbi:Branched-chain amino acid transport protein (AzlD) [Anoxybacillus sp. BCO1]|nr:Branched-chain amino acid transport protein (AzlD) [Anoxybacillus sp. BCO1]
MHSNIFLIILGMGLVTYIPRMLPLTLFHRIELPPFWRGVLRNVPYATLGALIIPGIFLSKTIGCLAFSAFSALSLLLGSASTSWASF